MMIQVFGKSAHFGSKKYILSENYQQTNLKAFVSQILT